MRFSIRSLLVLVAFVMFALAMMASRASRQRSAVNQLIKNHVDVHFSINGEFSTIGCNDSFLMGSNDGIAGRRIRSDNQPNHLIYSVTAVTINPAAKVGELIPTLRLLPRLKTIYLPGVFGMDLSKHEMYQVISRSFPSLEIKFYSGPVVA